GRPAIYVPAVSTNDTGPHRPPLDDGPIPDRTTGRHDQVKGGAITRVIVLRSLISTCRLGPAVSLKGSPTVSPTTAALCASEPLPPYCPVSMYFFALSQAPPPLLRSVATRIPAIVPTMRSAATASAPAPNAALNTTPTTIGIATARSPGSTIWRSAPRVTMSTQRP